MTLAKPCGRILSKVNTSFSASGPVGLGKRIGNRVQLPSGTATVSVEAGAEGESRSLGFSEKTLPRLRMREPGYLLRRFVYVRSCKYGIAAAFGAERRLRQFSKTAAAFLILWCCVCGFPLTIFDRLPSREFLRDRGGVDSPLLYYENLPRRSFMAAAAFVVMV